MSRKHKDLVCHYCNQPCVWVENKEIYGRNYGTSYMMWMCKPCDAYVGCHNNSKSSLGRVANKELRELRKQAKELFISRYLRKWTCANHIKETMYKRLANEIKIPVSQCHFGMFNESKCMDVIDLLYKKPALPYV